MYSKLLRIQLKIDDNTSAINSIKQGLEIILHLKPDNYSDRARNKIEQSEMMVK